MKNAMWVTFCIIFFVAGAAYGQDNMGNMSQKEMGMKSDTTHKMGEMMYKKAGAMKNGLMMKSGKMMMMMGGKSMVMDKEMAMPNGSKVTPNGEVTMKGGKKMMMKEGEMMDMKGNMMMGKSMVKKGMMKNDMMKKSDSIPMQADTMKNKY